MSIKIYEDTKIYIACPANVATGGPKNLHQLAYHLRNDLKIDASMFYYNYNKMKYRSPVHGEYIHYSLPYITNANKIEDDQKNILIVPEIKSGLMLLNKYKKIRKGVWFLSVDNYYLSKQDFLIEKIINKISKSIFKKPLTVFDMTSKKLLNQLIDKYNYREDPLLKIVDFYLSQSYYALKFFRDLKPNYYVSDYLDEAYLRTTTDLAKKENIVAYNPTKGCSFTAKLISRARDIKFVPIINMKKEQVVKTLQKAKVYIDFGNHPGKDRIPREAAILDCCVITGKRGSAAFFEDVSIPEEYKFEDTEKDIPKIIEKINDCFENFEERNKDFEYYRKIIRNEPQKFIDDLKKIFIKV
jgi:hypothetical protein